MRTQNWLVAAGVAAAVCLAAGDGMAQQNFGGGGGGGRGRRGNFDPAQMMQQRLEGYKEALEVNNDDEWKVLQPLVQKVMEAQMQAMAGMGRGMFGPRRGGPGGGGPGGGGGFGGGGGGGGMQRGPFGQPDPEADALQKVIDAKAPAADVKAALAKYVASRKARQEQLRAAQEQLRKLLTARQEAIATMNGLITPF